MKKNLSKNSYVISNKCVICVNQNAWATDSILKVWFNNIWLDYLRKAENLCENVGYIILDRAIISPLNFKYILSKYKNKKKINVVSIFCLLNINYILKN